MTNDGKIKDNVSNVGLCIIINLYTNIVSILFEEPLFQSLFQRIFLMQNHSFLLSQAITPKQLLMGVL